MWVCKSDAQIVRERSRVWLSFSGPAVLFLICFLAGIGIGIQGPRRGAGEGHWPDTLPKILCDAAVISTVVAIAGYVLQIVRRRKLDSLVVPIKVVMCDTCHRVKHRDRENKCECGGTFDDFDKWTWINGDG